MNTTQKILVSIIGLWGVYTMITRLSDIWYTLAHMSAKEAVIVTVITTVAIGGGLLIHRAFFAQYLDPVIKDAIASLQKHLGVRT
jgi:hypothetical protein